MGKIISLINITPDGFCDSEYVNADAEFHAFVHGLLQDTQLVGFGRHSFELFQQLWPTVLEKEHAPESQVRMALALGAIDKAVFSASLNSTSWSNTSIVRKTDADYLTQFKQRSSKNLLTIGSPGIVASLTKMGLTDEYYFPVQPLIAGGGKVRLFDKLQLDGRLPLQFVSATPLATGVVILHYQRKKN